MRLPEFLINLFVRFAPVDKETIANLKIQLMEYFTLNTSKVEEKKIMNGKYEARIADLNKQLDGLDSHSPEYDKILDEMSKLADKMEKPTIVETIIDFLEKPIVRVILLISFVFVSRYIAKKLTEVKQPEPEHEFQQQQQYSQNYQPQNYQGQPVQQQPVYNPYGYAPYSYPPQYPPYPPVNQQK